MRGVSIRLRSDVKWAAVLVAGVALLFGVAVFIGWVLAALSPVVAAFVAFAALVLVAGLLILELRSVWQRLPR